MSAVAQDVRGVALIGKGAIGGLVIEQLVTQDADVRIVAVVGRHRGVHPTGLPIVSNAADLPREARLVVEAAGADALRMHGPAVLESGRDLAILSTAALVDDGLHARLRDAARASGQRLYALCGAIGGIDALCAARVSGLLSVRYEGRKPPTAWRGTHADSLVDLDNIDAAKTFFEGTARDAARLFPRNANVTATIALAGIGSDRTRVTLIADPSIRANVHAFEVVSSAGRFRFDCEGYPMPSNPRTSLATACSVSAFLCQGSGAMLL